MTCPFCDDILTDLPIFYVYEKQPFIGEVHELTVEFGDDILTIFPFMKDQKNGSDTFLAIRKS